MRCFGMSLLDRATILPIQKDDVPYYWQYVRSFINIALEKHTDGECTLDNIYEDLLKNSRQLWVIKDGEYIAAVITTIHDTPSGKRIGEVTYAGGKNHHKWTHLNDVLGMWFKENGCQHMDILGRVGWWRLYKNKNYRIAYQQLRRDL